MVGSPISVDTVSKGRAAGRRVRRLEITLADTMGARSRVLRRRMTASRIGKIMVSGCDN